jgi:site-specific DNA recombinase
MTASMKPSYSQELFDKAQKLFKESPVARGNYTRNQHPALLRGLVECTCCDCMMTPTFAKKNNRIYRYYTPTTVNRQSYADCKVGNVPASQSWIRWWSRIFAR